MVKDEVHRVAGPQGQPGPGRSAVELERDRAGQGQHIGSAPGEQAAGRRLQQRPDQAVFGPRVGETQPVHRSPGPHQRGGSAVGEQRIISNRVTGHARTITDSARLCEGTGAARGEGPGGAALFTLSGAAQL
ncbi:hypothetical protein ACFVTE_20355 [Arthrobacter sp. NPDC058097]|uniref:hypothetical protein n=1 Tax=Arthrobacter sp. NPDC058097 TaxID=3346340 RepID=UPI0036D81880